jgi:hypothetical protein
MLADRHLLRLERSVSDVKGQTPSQTSAEFLGIHDAQVHKIVDAITAAVFNAEAGLNWLRAEPPDLENVRRALDASVNDGKRAAAIVLQLREFMKVPTANEAPDR